MPHGVQPHKADASEKPNEIILNIMYFPRIKQVRADKIRTFERILSFHSMILSQNISCARQRKLNGCDEP